MRQKDPNMDFNQQESAARFSTADLPLAQLLVARGYEPEIKMLNERNCSFEFLPDQYLYDVATAYQTGEALADPRALKAAEYRLRRAIDDVRQESQGGAQ